MTINEFSSLLKGVRGNGNQFTARCPAHDDRHSSLSVSQGEKGIVLHCHAGCPMEDVIAAMGLRVSDLYSDPPTSTAPSKQRAAATTRYEYQHADGALAYIKYRQDFGPKDKTFYFEQPNGTKNMKDVRREPYHLPEVLKDTIICFVEGEKCADALIERGITATTLDGGANSKWQAHYSDYFKGKLVSILPDNDEPGEKYALMIAEKLHGIAANVFIVRLPGLKEKGDDVCDWFKSGHTMDEFYDAVSNATEYEPHQCDI